MEMRCFECVARKCIAQKCTIILLLKSTLCATFSNRAPKKKYVVFVVWISVRSSTSACRHCAKRPLVLEEFRRSVCLVVNVLACEKSMNHTQIRMYINPIHTELIIEASDHNYIIICDPDLCIKLLIPLSEHKAASLLPLIGPYLQQTILHIHFVSGHNKQTSTGTARPICPIAIHPKYPKY